MLHQDPNIDRALRNHLAKAQRELQKLTYLPDVDTLKKQLAPLFRNVVDPGKSKRRRRT